LGSEYDDLFPWPSLPFIPIPKEYNIPALFKNNAWHCPHAIEEIFEISGILLNDILIDS